jgi:hypothetical protein
MQNRVPIERPASFYEFVELIENYQRRSSDPLWYRGCGSIKHRLIPGLYRHEQIKSASGLSKLEHDLMVRFRQRSIPFHSQRLDDDWDTMFLMQHYRIPTRLLDWTENPFIALYFALTSANLKLDEQGNPELDEDGQPQYEHSAAVWMLNPTIWNRHALSHQSFDGSVLAPGDEYIKGYNPTVDFTTMNNYPVAIYGSHNSPRIVAQRGVFTVFGQKTKSMAYLYGKGNFPQGSLVKIKLAAANISDTRKSLFSHGITESVVFPDLDGLAKEIRRSFHFEP